MPRIGVIVIVQSASASASVQDTCIADLHRYYAMPNAPWRVEHARIHQSVPPTSPQRRVERQAQSICDSLTQLINPRDITRSHSILLSQSLTARVAWKQYWETVVSNRGTRNHIIVTPMTDAPRHVDILGAILLNDETYSSSFLPAATHDGKAVIFADFTCERYVLGQSKEPYDLVHMLKG